MNKPDTWRGGVVCRIAGTIAIAVYLVLALGARPGAAYTIDGFIDSWTLQETQAGTPVTPIRNSHPPVHCSSGAPAQQITPSRRTTKIDHLLLLCAGFTGLMIPFARRRYNELKRLFDIIGSGFALSLLSPLILVIALLIKIDSPGPVFFQQVRVGMNRRRIARRMRNACDRRDAPNLGSLFKIYKFRTMRTDAESKTGPVWARENDDRVTRVGRLLRKTHLDEIPQFINVLRGEMCIIGPRPERPVFINRLNDCFPSYARRLEIKPGITGLAQVRYRYAASIQDAKIKLKYDLVYIQKMSFILDFGILFNTLNIMVSTKGAR